MWAFVEGGLRPDLVTLGKPMGNGHPVAAVITRREVAAAMAERYEYFSTFGGSPVSAVAALATLDVLEDRRLAQRASATGAHLRERLSRLADSVTWIGEVRGRGLLAGVEVKTSAETGTTARAVAEALRHERVLIGVTGRHRDVLKIRPPLVWDESDVDHLVNALRRVASSIDAAHR
jgi:4-aminobutyrate aminotransferase-like enzyme